LEVWLETLSMTVTVEPLTAANLPRVVQLLNKTNQFNLTTRRVTEAELQAWVAKPGHQFWAFRVSDKFGDSGLTGVASLVKEDIRGRVEDFVLSCRVMGRRVEETMLRVVLEWARRDGLSEVYAIYRPTAKNKPCLDFFERSGLQSPTERVFEWNLQREYPACSAIRLIEQTTESLVGDRTDSS